MMRNKQSGSVLMISLVILFALTVLVLSGSKTVVIQEKMTAAVRDVHVSLEIAESGIRDAEAYIETLAGTNAFNDAGNGGLYSEGNGPTDLFASATWENTITRDATTAVSGEVGLYYIEYLGVLSSSSTVSVSVSINGYGETDSASEASLFKIVSRSLGRSGQTERVVISNYAISF